MDNTNNTPEEVTTESAQTEVAEETKTAEAAAPAAKEDKKEKVITDLPRAEKPAPAPAPTATPYAVIGSGDTDDVFLSKCIFKNVYARKSLTVHHLQRRLTELGYKHANSDKDGWYGDLTKQDVAAFQSDFGIEGSGEMNADTFAAIFDGDVNVTVHLS
jgi:peptidoglycan hydrolase-like protein with peptidoglycan-binding domain